MTTLLMRRLAFAQYYFLLPVLLSSSAVSATATTKKPSVQPININAVNSEQSQEMPGIGPPTAEKILQMRKSYGPFKSVDDLLAIRGIGPNA